VLTNAITCIDQRLAAVACCPLQDKHHRSGKIAVFWIVAYQAV
jgi:hypothetical protein